MSSTDPRTFITMLVWLEPDGMAALGQFRQSARALFERYDVRVERVLAGHAKGQLLDTNPWDVPDVIQVISMPSMERFRAYASDPEYQRLAIDRDAGVRRMVAVFGGPVDAGVNPQSASSLDERLYGAAFVRFMPGGAEALLDFNRRASGLFARHGMHVERMIDTAAVATPVGAPLAGFAPQRTVIFFLDDPAALSAYAADPEYKSLAPIRDVGLERYDFFVARVAAPSDTGVERFVREPSAFEYDFEDVSHVRITSARLDGDDLVTTYTYSVGAEQRHGENHLARRGAGFHGTWRTTSSSGAVFEGPVSLEFSADGAARGTWAMGTERQRAIRVLRASEPRSEP